MTETINWLKLNWDEIIALYGALVIVASIVVKLTPTLKDDNFLLKTVKFVSKYVALNRGVEDSAIRKLKE